MPALGVPRPHRPGTTEGRLEPDHRLPGSSPPAVLTGRLKPGTTLPRVPGKAGEDDRRENDAWGGRATTPFSRGRLTDELFPLVPLFSTLLG